MTEGQPQKETCPMCGEKDSATLDHHNGGWTKIECDECRGGLFYLWIRSDKPCTRSLTMLN